MGSRTLPGHAIFTAINSCVYRYGCRPIISNKHECHYSCRYYYNIFNTVQ